MEDLQFFKAHIKAILSAYTIPEYGNAISSSLGYYTGAVCLPFPGLMKMISEFNKKETPDIYPLLISLCKEKGLTEVELYQKARLKRDSFSKIRSMKRTGYRPNVTTALRLCLALQLNLQQTQQLLGILDYHLSNNSFHDKVIACCIEHKFYNIDDIDSIIYEETGKYYLCQ